MEHAFADHDLARRLESLAAAEMRRFAETAARVFPDSAAEWAPVAGGVAAYIGPGSPVNQTAGMGFSAAVIDADIETLERFYSRKGARPVVQVCPLAHGSLALALAERGWVIDGFENVLVTEVAAHLKHPRLPRGLRIIACETADQRADWALVAANGFSAPLDPSPGELAVSRIVVERPGARLYLALVDGKPAATGELLCEDGVGWLSADSTLPQYRGRGLQQLLQSWRIAEASAAGCTLAATESLPGSASQRNQERTGFRIAYTRVDMTTPTKGT